MRQRIEESASDTFVCDGARRHVKVFKSVAILGYGRDRNIVDLDSKKYDRLYETTFVVRKIITLTKLIPGYSECRVWSVECILAQ